MPQASVIVVTRNNAELLEDALASVLADGSRVSRELIVVDNGSTDETQDVAARAAATAPWEVRILRVQEAGLSRGRNAAIACARGDLLLFTDDDVLVEDGWADALVHAFDAPDVGFAAGRTFPIWPVEPPAWLDGEQRIVLALYDHGPESRELGAGEYGAGANMAIRRSLLADYDPPFEPVLGHQGGRLFAGEETLLVDRLRTRSRLVYVPAAVVRHRVRAERMTLEFLRRSYFDRGAASYRYQVLSEGGSGLGLARRLVRAQRAARKARGLARRNGSERTADEFLAELGTFGHAGQHVEMAVGRLPRLTRLIRDLVA